MNKFEYAKKRLDLMKDEVDGIHYVFILTHGAEQNLYIGFPNGMNIKLHDAEVNYQAISYLESEIERIKQEV